MFGALVTLLSTLAAPTISDSAASRLVQGYPEWALREGRSVAFQANLVVLPDGKARSCEVVGAIGSERLAAEMCEKFARIRFKPATDVKGSPVVGLVRTWLVLEVKGGRDHDLVRRAVWPTDVHVSTEFSAPQHRGAPERNVVKVSVLVGTDGAVHECELSNDGQRAVPAEILEIACRAVAGWRGTSLMNERGQSVPYVTTVAVGFEKPVKG
jgi:hypothetical protein